MTADNTKKTIKIESITQKLEAIRRISNTVLQEVEIFAERSRPNLKNINFYEEIERLETELILYALYQANGNQRLAAQILNIKKTTLNAKIKKLNLLSRIDKSHSAA